MYLTRIDLQPQVRAIQQALVDCQKMHRLVSGLFQTARKDANVLYRLRIEPGRTAVYLYSDMPVNRAALIPGMVFGGERDLSDWLKALENGQVWRFDLLAAPMKKVAAEGQKNSRRRILREPSERLAWLNRKAEQAGFAILGAEEKEGIHVIGTHSEEQGGRMHWDGYRYDGVLQIRQKELFQRAMRTGIGAGKAYGMGMMLLRR